MESISAILLMIEKMTHHAQWLEISLKSLIFPHFNYTEILMFLFIENYIQFLACTSFAFRKMRLFRRLLTIIVSCREV